PSKRQHSSPATEMDSDERAFGPRDHPAMELGTSVANKEGHAMGMRTALGILLLAGSTLLGLGVTANAQERGTPSVLPRPDFHFPGNVGRTYVDSDPAQFPQPIQAPTDAPNVVLILIDDVGFGQFSTFGGGVPSPTMDKLAA